MLLFIILDAQYQENFLSFWRYQKNNRTFAFALVRRICPYTAMKRESGENPEQTRYCKSHATF